MFRQPMPVLYAQNEISPHASPVTAAHALPRFLKYAGAAPESDLIRDYEREYHEEHRPEQTRLKELRNPKNVVDIILSPEYKRYLER